VLQSDYIVGHTPKAGNIGQIDPLNNGNNNNRPNAVALAQQQERGRERVKRRTLTIKRHYQRGRSPSLPRMPIQNDGTGAGYMPPYLAQHNMTEDMPPIAVDSNVPYSEAANISAWITQPMRDGF
jgi:hypothetical protein